MGDLQKLSPWSEGLGRQAQAEALMDKPLRVRLWVIRVLLSGVAVFFIREENIVVASCTLYSSLIIVKSLQLREYRQIAKPRKYCLMRVIISLACVFSIFCFSQVRNLG